MPFHFLPGVENRVEWIEELRVWSEVYEERYMVPAKSNAVLADATLKILLWKMPQWTYSFRTKIFATIIEGMSPRLRKAML